MENASKALLMAGGVLLGILLVSLLLYAWKTFSKYQSSDTELTNIENISKFNQQFTNYDRDDVEGYELITLANQIVDYNQRKSNLGGNDEKFKPIEITIDLSKGNRQVFVYNNGSNNLFTTNRYYEGKSPNSSPFSKVINDIKVIESTLGGSDSASKIAKSYDSIFTDSTNSEVLKKSMDKYNSLTIKKINNTNLLKTNSSRSTAVLKYYEYIQFKRAVFKCTKLEYDEAGTGRVKIIEFDWTGKIH